MRQLPAFQNAKVAFIILAWNSESYLERCLASVLQLVCAKLDVWVVNNGSLDGTPEILNRISRKDGRVHVITEQQNLGTTKSRNKAIRCVSKDTDYLCVLDSDTVVNQNAFDTLAEELMCDPHIGVIGPVMRNSAGEMQLSGRNIPTPLTKLLKVMPIKKLQMIGDRREKPDVQAVDGRRDVGYLLSACWLMPYSSIQQVGCFDEKIFYAPEDADWCARCAKSGLRVVWSENAQIIHEYQRLSHKKLISKINFEHVKGLIYFWAKMTKKTNG